MRKLVVLLGLAAFALAGCSGPEMLACTEMGASAGIGVEVEGPVGSDAKLVAVTACWDGNCTTETVDLLDSTTAGPEECTGTDPDSSCSVTMIPTGNKFGFVPLADLPASGVELEVSVLSTEGIALVQGKVGLTPQLTYPNGSQCPAGGLQGSVTIDSAGRMTVQ